MLHTHLQLGHPVRTLHLSSVTVLSQDRLAYSRAGQVVVKDLIHNDGYAFIDIAPVNPFVVKGSGGGNGEVVSLIPVPLGINPVQGERHDGQHIGGDGCLGPGGVNFAGGHIFDIIPVGYIIIFCAGICGNAVVNHNGLGNHHTA